MWASTIGKWLVIAGLVALATGALFLLAAKVFPSLGHLPGDIHVQREKGELHFPVVTCLLVSLALTLVLNLLLRFFRS
jgi:hypothetical protein